MSHTNIVRRQDQNITNSLDCALKEETKENYKGLEMFITWNQIT